MAELVEASRTTEFILQRWSDAHGEWLDGGWFGNSTDTLDALKENERESSVFLYRAICRTTTETVIKEQP